MNNPTPAPEGSSERRPAYKCGCRMIVNEIREGRNLYAPKCPTHGEIIDYTTIL